MFRPRTLLLVFLLVISLTWLSFSGVWKKAKSGWAFDHPQQYELPAFNFKKMKGKAEEARSFIARKGYNSSICFLIDMSLPSSQNRFYVYDLKRDTIKNSGLVTHGRCNQNWLNGRKYGNTVGCGCTSLGKYKIGYSYNGKFGLAFKLYGLDSTNNKAFDRFVVLHGHDCVPESEVKDEICQSDGCPTVSLNFLQYLKPVITESGKPVLLWIYE
ncbi:MAG: murein L,D-transpeptidase catalytic domain-containing protein [Chitinophagaceae bacterium]